MPIPKPSRTGRRQLVRDVVFDRLRDAIVAGELVPGEPIVEKDVEQWANASRTPVREAIDRLAAVHLVEVLPQRGTNVAPLDRERTLQSFSVLGELLPDGLDQVVDVLSPSQARVLQRTAASTGDTVQLFARGGLLDSIVGVVGNPRYRQVWDELAPHLQRSWNVEPGSAPSIDGLDLDAFADLVGRGDAGASDVLRAWFAGVDAYAAPGLDGSVAPSAALRQTEGVR
jgi:DNA-binding GntR family transcriptional regulator